MDDLKTEERVYVSGIRCDPEFAARQFQKTKQHYKKTGGILAFHGYQSFKPGEVDADTAHRIGVELAKELWGDRFKVVVATHLNTDHYHNHFVINSVSIVDGYRYYDNKETYRRMREVSDRLCKEHHLSVIKNPVERAKAMQNGQLRKTASLPSVAWLRQTLTGQFLLPQPCVTFTGSWNRWGMVMPCYLHPVFNKLLVNFLFIELIIS